ncbi:MAG: ABC transporter ATP-binding protein [Fimbriimonadaceae bacterium]
MTEKHPSTTEKTGDSSRIFGQLWAIVKPYQGKFILSICFLLLAVPLGQFAIFLTRDVTNQALNTTSFTIDERWDAVIRIIILQAGFWLASTLLSTWREVLEWYVSMRSTLDLRLKYYRHLHSLPMSFLGQYGPGAHLYRSTADMVSLFRVGNRVETSTPAGQMPPESKEVQTSYYYSNDVDPYDPGVMGIITRSMPLFVETIYAMGWGIALLYLIDPMLSLFLVCYIVPFSIVSYFAFNRVRAAAFDFKDGVENESKVLRDSISGLRTMKAFGRTSLQLKKYFLAAGQARRNGIRMYGELVKAQNILQQFMRWSFTSIVYIYLARKIVIGQATIGDWVATALLIESAQMPLQNFVQLTQLLKMQLVPIRRIFATLDTEPRLLDKQDARVLDGIDGALDFKDLTFSYVEGEPVIHGLTLAVKPGEYLGIVGPSGAGKSSLVSLALRLYGPDTGSVFVDGNDLADIQLKSYLKRVASVPQSTYLYAGTIAENVLFGNPDATPEELQLALDQSGASAFLSQHVDGAETMISESAPISGGERQRIGIARALIRDPKILFLDEATASLDPVTEDGVLQTIQKIRPGRTVITIAHRLKAVTQCDRIIVLSEGRIVQEGSHAELLAVDGLYKELWAQQWEITKVEGRVRD